MLFHASISADDPRHTAEAIAAIWGGRAYPFPAIAPGSWMAMAGDDRGSAVEVLPRGAELHRKADEPVVTRHGERSRHGPVHLLVASPHGEAEILAIADGYGFPAHKAMHGRLPILECWIDDCFLLEVMTPEIEAIYREAATFENAERWIAGAMGAEALERLAA